MKSEEVSILDETEIATKAWSHTNNTNLPNGSQEQDKFRRCFIPAVFWHVATLTDAFKTVDTELVPSLQKIWDATYGCTVPYEIKVNDPVFQVVHSNFTF